ncbi:MAG: Beta-lactamase [candidate division BRC1 bacterium ADurb.BinA292]|nr:MAG: Beta-lactamase [candidate division BRC1 bacterium ADurb.BinA292]
MKFSAHSRGFIALLGVLVVLALPSPYDAWADAAGWVALSDSLFAPLVRDGDVAGLIAGVTVDDQRTIQAWGEARLGGHVPDAETLFEIGSITKTFTGALLARMAGIGEVGLDDPVQLYLDGLTTAPQVGPEPIRLWHLATHTSGLPRIMNHTAGQALFGDNPYANITPAMIYEWLGEVRLKAPPGETSEYSNMGMGLLGHVLALRAGTGYETLLRERILWPLRMQQTVIALDAAQSERLAPGYRRRALKLPLVADFKRVPAWDMPHLEGMGALRSNVGDMLTWVEANLCAIEIAQGEPTPVAGNSSGPAKVNSTSPLEWTEEVARPPRGDALFAALRVAMQPRARVSADTEIGLAWQLTTLIDESGTTRTMIWHNGATGGHHAFLGLDPARRLGLVVLANTATDRIESAAFDFFRHGAAEVGEAERDDKQEREPQQPAAREGDTAKPPAQPRAEF